MTHYIDYIRALKAGVTINDYSHTYKLMRLASMRHVKSEWVMPVVGKCFTRYYYQSPVVTVADAPLAVESLPANPLPRESKVHLWHTYPDGTRKPSMGTWEVGTHYVVSKNGMQMECVVLIQKGYDKPITRLRSQVCDATEYAAYLAQVTGVQIAAA